MNKDYYAELRAEIRHKPSYAIQAAVRSGAYSKVEDVTYAVHSASGALTRQGMLRHTQNFTDPLNWWEIT